MTQTVQRVFRKRILGMFAITWEYIANIIFTFCVLFQQFELVTFSCMRAIIAFFLPFFSCFKGLGFFITIGDQAGAFYEYFIMLLITKIKIKIKIISLRFLLFLILILCRNNDHDEEEDFKKGKPHEAPTTVGSWDFV